MKFESKAAVQKLLYYEANNNEKNQVLTDLQTSHTTFSSYSMPRPSLV